jgi:uncharacterized protein
MFSRVLKDKILSIFFSGNVIVLTGARQVGKTTLIESVIEHSGLKNSVLKFNGDYLEDRDFLEKPNLNNLLQTIGDSKIIFIDEGQKIPGIGNTLKILVDKYKIEKQIIVTGSSSLNLLDQTQEPLTGRKRVFILHPLSILEITPEKSYYKIQNNIQDFLIYGMFPKVVNQESYKDKIEVLKELATSNLYKDIFEFQSIRNPNVLTKLLRALALQIGSEVSMNEIAGLIGLDQRTVERYIDLLEKCYIIYRLPPFYTNKRKEISKKNKVFFFDLGIRNSIINNYNNFDSRNDIGGLWENFIINERIKYREYYSIYSSQYFWRGFDGNGVDLVEEREGKLYGYEFKWKKDSKNTKPPKGFIEYKGSEYKVIDRENFMDFLS